jgi:hypothetical protein
VASGKSVIGGNSLSPKTSSRLTSLAAMLGNDGDFEMAFEQNHKEEKKTQGKTKVGKKHDHIENLLQQSRTFLVNGIEFNYKDSDPIFFIREPNQERKQLNNCQSCALKFTDSKQMCYCQFCGFANCKNCLKKTRVFYDDQAD